MDILLEGVVLDPLGIRDVSSFITEGLDIDDSWFIEATAGTTKKNFFSKIWSLMKRLFAIIRAKVSEISSAFMSIFRTKKVDDKTMDQIAEFVLGDTPDAPSSKHVSFRYENDKQITINYIANTIKKFVKEPEVQGHDKKDRPYQYAILLAFHVVKKPYLLDPIIEMIESIGQNNGQISFSHERMAKAIDTLWAGTAFGFRCTITMEEWTNLNDKLIKLNKAMEIIDDDSLGKISIGGADGLSPEWAKIMNDLVRITGYIQKGINCIGDGMRQVYALDEKFHNRINSKNYQTALPKFVKMCVESNIPGKYIYYAIGQICDVSVHSDLKDPTKKGQLAALKGNGRFVIFPGDPSLQSKVIKIGYNGLGVRGNRNEFVVWDKIKDIPEIAQELYHIYDFGDKDNYVIITDRVKPIDNYKDCDDWNKRMKQMCIDNNVGFIIRCNAGGFGELNGKVVCCDYGNVHRIDR